MSVVRRKLEDFGNIITKTQKVSLFLLILSYLDHLSRYYITIFKCCQDEKDLLYYDVSTQISGHLFFSHLLSWCAFEYIFFNFNLWYKTKVSNQHNMHINLINIWLTFYCFKWIYNKMGMILHVKYSCP